MSDTEEPSKSRGGERSQTNTEDAFEHEADGRAIKNDETKPIAKTALRVKRLINVSKKLRHKAGVVYFWNIPP